jgi:DNA repair protein RadC
MRIRIPKIGLKKITGPQDVFIIMQKILLRQNRLHRQKEYFWVIGLNTPNDILYIELAVIGILNTVQLDPVEVFSFAVSKKCKKLILVHNHPSGALKASPGDIRLTKSLMQGAALLKIEILDHLIISEEGFLSLKEEGVV